MPPPRTAQSVLTASRPRNQPFFPAIGVTRRIHGPRLVSHFIRFISRYDSFRVGRAAVARSSFWTSPNSTPRLSASIMTEYRSRRAAAPSASQHALHAIGELMNISAAVDSENVELSIVPT